MPLHQTNLISPTQHFKNTNLVEQLKVELYQKKVLTDLLSKILCGVTATQSENQNANKRKCTDKTRRRGDCISIEEKQYDPLDYFWTHGYKFDVGHKSWTCRTSRYNKNHKKKLT